MEIQNLPTLNACLNSLAVVFLFFGRRAIKRGNTGLHRRLMIMAISVSALFLTSYLYYHYNVPGAK